VICIRGAGPDPSDLDNRPQRSDDSGVIERIADQCLAPIAGPYDVLDWRKLGIIHVTESLNDL
jgi:hypothetical protein